MKIVFLHDILLHELKDIYSAEQQIIAVLPKLIKHSSTGKLRKAFSDHLHQTQKQLARLEKVASELHVSLEGHFCKGMEGLLEEVEPLLKEEKSPAIDAALISAAQRVEHYEIAAYGCAITYAEHMRKGQVAKVLQSSLNEEMRSDRKLSDITVATVIPKLASKKKSPVERRV